MLSRIWNLATRIWRYLRTWPSTIYRLPSNNRNAFTIIELLVVIIVIAVLVALSIVGYSTITSKANVASLQSDLTNNSKKLKLYYAQYGSYPTRLDDNYCPLSPTPDTTGTYCLKLSSSNTLNNYSGSNLNYTLGISNSTNTSTCYQITSTTNPTNTCSAPSGSYQAEKLLSEATWWIDASYSTNGQTISNLGTGGAVLNATNGSTSNTDTNDARWLAAEDTGYVYLPASSGAVVDGLTVQDSAVSFGSGDLDVRVRVAPDDWTPPTFQSVLSKYNIYTSGQRSFSFGPASYSTGLLELTWSPDGTNAITVDSTANAAIVPDGSVAWIRATLDVDNGAGQYAVSFYKAADSVTEPSSWVKVGATIVGSTGVTSIFDSTTNFRIGALTDNAYPFAGKFYRAIVKNSIDGQTILDIDADVISTGYSSSFNATTGQTVAVSRSSTGRKSLTMPSILKGGSSVFLMGSDDFLEVADNDLMDFAANDSFSVLTVGRQWASLGTFSVLMSKRDSSNAAWSLSSRWSVAYNHFRVDQVTGTTFSEVYSSTVNSLGPLFILTGVKDAISSTMSSYSGAQVNSISTTNRSASANNSNLRVPASGVDAEIYAAAIFRRALTPAEITTISSYYTNRIK